MVVRNDERNEGREAADASQGLASTEQGRAAAKPVELVLVVKGAGTQAPGDTLDLFTSGLWPAVLSEDDSARLRERVVGEPEEWLELADDSLPAAMLGEGPLSGSPAKMPPVPPTVFEIETRSRRIWVREVNWEVALRAPSPLKAVLREWRMATWVLLFEFFQWFSSLYRFAFPRRAEATVEHARSEAEPGELPELPVNFWHLTLAFWAAYGSLLGVAEAVILAAGRGGMLSLVDLTQSSLRPVAWLFGHVHRANDAIVRNVDAFARELPLIGPEFLPGAFVASTLWVMVLAMVAAFPSAFRSKLWHEQQQRLRAAPAGSRPEDAAAEAPPADQPLQKRSKLASVPLLLDKALDERKLRRGRPPSPTNALLLVLVAALLLSPVNYVAVLLLLLAWQASLLVLRGLLWRYRRVDESDVEGRFTGDLARRFAPDDAALEPPNPRRRQQLRFPLFIYRTIVVAGLPLILLLYALAKLLQWTRILASIGKALEALLQVWLGGIMGDVVSYAMDPAKAARIRSTVERELRFFEARPEVRRLHVVAHSQGTAITFELLFRHLERARLEKIHTYLTLGSVLSYYHHADAVLDPHHYDQRFPPAEYPDPSDFAAGFRWFNCWNLTDPITEFYGLDEFLLPREGAHAESPLVLPALSQEQLDDLHPLSPTNIKTPASLRHHSDYWTNQVWVQRPLARRLLGKPERWKQAPRVANQDNRWGHARLIFVLHSLAVVFIGLGFAYAFLEPFHQVFDTLLAQLIGPESGGAAEGDGMIRRLGADIRAGIELMNDPRLQPIRLQMIVYGLLAVPLVPWLAILWAGLRTFLFSAGKALAGPEGS